MSTDIADLQRKALAAREFTHTVGAATYTLRLPTPHEKQVEILRATGGSGVSDPALGAVLLRLLLERAVVAWVGVKASQLAPGAGSDAVDLVPGAVPLLLDSDPGTATELGSELVRRENERNTHVEAAQKN